MTSPPSSDHRVIIDGIGYDCKVAGTDRYGVYDEFGGHLGYFEVRRRAIVPDDFGVTGAPAIMRIGKAWLDEAGPQPEKTSFHVCRIARVNDADDVTVRCAKAYTDWLKQCGAKAAFVAYDEETKKLSLVSVWGARTRMANALAKEPPVGASEPASAEVEIIGLAQDF